MISVNRVSEREMKNTDTMSAEEAQAPPARDTDPPQAVASVIVACAGSDRLRVLKISCVLSSAKPISVTLYAACQARSQLLLYQLALKNTQHCSVSINSPLCPFQSVQLSSGVGL